jgi:hypothetical protein
LGIRLHPVAAADLSGSPDRRCATGNAGHIFTQWLEAMPKHIEDSFLVDAPASEYIHSDQRFIGPSVDAEVGLSDHQHAAVAAGLELVPMFVQYHGTTSQRRFPQICPTRLNCVHQRCVIYPQVGQ